MSWSLNVKIPKGTTPKAATEAMEALTGGGNDAAPKARDAQQAAAKAAAIGLLKSGAVGSLEQSAFSVSLSGHANPDHAPRAGWSDDFITLNVSQIIEEKTS